MILQQPGDREDLALAEFDGAVSSDEAFAVEAPALATHSIDMIGVVELRTIYLDPAFASLDGHYALTTFDSVSNRHNSNSGCCAFRIGAPVSLCL